MNRFDDDRHIKWAKAVKQRDNYTCQICGRAGVVLHSHHLNSYDTFIEQRLDIDNGITLCYNCHINLFHKIYSSGGNTIYQFEEFKKMMEIIKGVVVNNKIVKI